LKLEHFLLVGEEARGGNCRRVSVRETGEEPWERDFKGSRRGKSEVGAGGGRVRRGLGVRLVD